MKGIPIPPELGYAEYQTFGIKVLAQSLHYADLELDALVKLHNEWFENDWAADGHLSMHLLNHPVLRAAITGISKGVIVEIGSHRAITLDQLAKQYGPQLNGTLVIGIDKNIFFGERMAPIQFYSIVPKSLADAGQICGRPVLNPEFFANGSLLVYMHVEHPNTFAVYGLTAEEAFLPQAKLDLVILKCMLGYLGNTPSKSLEYVKRKVLPRAESVFILDYIGRCNFSKVDIPEPKAVAVEVGRAFSSSKIFVQQEKNYFMLYAQR